MAVGGWRQLGDTVLDLFPTFFADLRGGLQSAGILAFAYFGLIAVVSFVAVFGKGPRGKRARAVLKLLLRTKQRDRGQDE